MRLAPRLAFGLVLLLPFSGRAQEVTAQTAQSLQNQVRTWIAGIIGAGMDPALLTPKIVAEDDHYNLTLAIPGLVGDETVSARLRPLENGRWSLQKVEFPPSMHFNLRLPEPGGKPKAMTAFTATLGSQDMHAVFDPALNSRSELAIDLQGVSLRSDGPQGRQEQRIGEYKIDASLQPTANGLLDFDQTATITAWSNKAQIKGEPDVSFGADRMHATGRITGLNREQAQTLLSATSGFLATLPPGTVGHGKQPKLTPEGRTALRQLVESLRGIASSIHAEEDIDGLHVAVAGVGEGSVKHARLGFGGTAPDGLLHTYIELAFDGLSLPDLPPEIATLLPRHVSLRPSFSGIPTEALLKLLLEATRPGADQSQLTMEAMSLMKKGATVALEKLGFDLGPATVQGSGRVMVVGPNQYVGKAHLTATGFDALMQQARKDPTLQQGIPVLGMLRGYAKPEGDHLVWNIVARDGGVSVNGVPLIPPAGADNPGGGGADGQR